MCCVTDLNHDCMCVCVCVCVCVFVRQTSILALLSTSDRAITLPAKRWTPPVSGQLIVRLDACALPDTLVNTTAPSAHGHCPIHNHCWVLLHIREHHRVFTISPGRKGIIVQCHFYCGTLFFLRAFVLDRKKFASVCVCLCLCSNMFSCVNNTCLIPCV